MKHLDESPTTGSPAEGQELADELEHLLNPRLHRATIGTIALNLKDRILTALRSSPSHSTDAVLEEAGDCRLEQLLSRYGLVLTDDPDFDHNEDTFAKAKVGLVNELVALSKPPLPEGVDGLVERLREKARTASDLSKAMAAAKSRRQTDNPEGRDDLYEWSTPEQMTEWKAADTIQALQAENDRLRSLLTSEEGVGLDG